MFSDLSHSVYPVGRDLRCVQGPCVLLVVPELGLELGGSFSVFCVRRGTGGLAGCQLVVLCHGPTTIPREEVAHLKECSFLSLFSPSVLSYMRQRVISFPVMSFLHCRASCVSSGPQCPSRYKKHSCKYCPFTHLLLFSSSHHKGFDLFHS